MTKTSLGQVLEAANQLPLEEQESLIDILRQRIREARRADILRDIWETQQEFYQGKCQVLTPEELIREIVK
jgi:hypothetical protein